MKHDSSEMLIFIQIWIIVFFSLIYTFFVGKHVSPGKTRFILILPIMCLFLVLPLRLSTIHLGGLFAFFIPWLANFKLILYSFNKGPLSPPSSTVSLLRFIAAASLPIEITPSTKLDDNPRQKMTSKPDPGSHIWKEYAVKVVMMAVIFKLYFDFKTRLHPTAIMFLLTFLIYFSLDFLLALARVAAQAGLGVQLEPHFSKPHKASSLKNFWGRRWNLMVCNTLRLAVHQPVMGMLAGQLGRHKAHNISVLITFGVSGIMHELFMYSLTRMYPSGTTFAFFLLNGVCVVSETAFVRKYREKMHVPRIVSSVLAIWFVITTASLLFFSEFLRCELDDRGFKEYAAVVELLVGVYNSAILGSLNGTDSTPLSFTQVNGSF